MRIQAFFEYKPGHRKTYKIEHTKGQPFYFAGLWEILFDIDTGMLLPTMVMITMSPNCAISEIHDRMPANLERDIKNWINPNLSGEQHVPYLAIVLARQKN